MTRFRARPFVAMVVLEALLTLAALVPPAEAAAKTVIGTL